MTDKERAEADRVWKAFMEDMEQTIRDCLTRHGVDVVSNYVGTVWGGETAVPKDKAIGFTIRVNTQPAASQEEKQ